MRPMIEALDRLRPCDQFQLADYHLTKAQPAVKHLIGKRVLVESAAYINDDVLSGQIRLTIANPHGAMGDGTEVVVWAGATAEQWWYEGGARRGTWRGPLHPLDLAD